MTTGPVYETTGPKPETPEDEPGPTPEPEPTPEPGPEPEPGEEATEEDG